MRYDAQGCCKQQGFLQVVLRLWGFAEQLLNVLNKTPLRIHRGIGFYHKPKAVTVLYVKSFHMLSEENLFADA